MQTSGGLNFLNTSSSAAQAASNNKPASLLHVHGSFDSNIEKLELIEKKKSKRKVYQDQETGYELQDLYRINDSLNL